MLTPKKNAEFTAHIIVRVSSCTLNLAEMVACWEVEGIELVHDGRVQMERFPASLKRVLDGAVRAFEQIVACDIKEHYADFDIVVEAASDGADEVAIIPTDDALLEEVTAYRDQHIAAWVDEFHESYADVKFSGTTSHLTYPPGRYVMVGRGWIGRTVAMPVDAATHTGSDTARLQRPEGQPHEDGADDTSDQ